MCVCVSVTYTYLCIFTKGIFIFRAFRPRKAFRSELIIEIWSFVLYTDQRNAAHTHTHTHPRIGLKQLSKHKTIEPHVWLFDSFSVSLLSLALSRTNNCCVCVFIFQNSLRVPCAWFFVDKCIFPSIQSYLMHAIPCFQHDFISTVLFQGTLFLFFSSFIRLHLSWNSPHIVYPFWEVDMNLHFYKRRTIHQFEVFFFFFNIFFSPSISTETRQ